MKKIHPPLVCIIILLTFAQFSSLHIRGPNWCCRCQEWSCPNKNTRCESRDARFAIGTFRAVLQSLLLFLTTDPGGKLNQQHNQGIEIAVVYGKDDSEATNDRFLCKRLATATSLLFPLWGKSTTRGRELVDSTLYVSRIWLATDTWIAFNLEATVHHIGNGFAATADKKWLPILYLSPSCRSFESSLRFNEPYFVELNSIFAFVCVASRYSMENIIRLVLLILLAVCQTSSKFSVRSVENRA